MKIFDLLKPVSYQKEIQDAELVQRGYRYWRIRTFIAMYVGYAFYYFTRKSFTYAMPEMQDSLGMDKFHLGLLASILSLTYGASKFLSGIVGDKSNPRYFMSIGLILTGIFNLLFGASSTWLCLAIFWGMNGLFQGWGWPSCAKCLTHWYSQSERGRWWSVWNTSHNLGGYLIPLLAGLCVEYLGWRYALYIPGLISILAGFFVMALMRDTPQSLGLPPIEKFRNDYSMSRKFDDEECELSARQILVDYVLKNKFVWMLAIASFFIYVIRTGLNDWMMMYLKEMRGYSSLMAGSCVSFFEAGGFFGSLAAGWGSDVFFKGKRTPVNVLFTIGVVVTILLFRLLTVLTPFWDGVYIFSLGFFIFGPQMLIGIACAELSHKKAAGTATGFAGTFAYLGAAMAGGPLGAAITHWGWQSFFTTMVVCGLVAVVCMLPLWSLKTNPSIAKKSAA
jgi:OPA family sugar phosphate sensor protein UhpC-like MFS transporter